MAPTYASPGLFWVSILPVPSLSNSFFDQPTSVPPKNDSWKLYFKSPDDIMHEKSAIHLIYWSTIPVLIQNT